MPLLIRIILALVLIAVLLFCAYGFLATFEPLERSVQITWRIVYGGVGSACIGGAAWLVFAKRREP